MQHPLNLSQRWIAYPPRNGTTILSGKTKPTTPIRRLVSTTTYTILHQRVCEIEAQSTSR